MTRFHIEFNIDFFFSPSIFWWHFNDSPQNSNLSVSETTVDHVSNLEREHFDMDDNYIHVDCYMTTCTDIFKVVYLIYIRFILWKNLQKIEKMCKKILASLKVIRKLYYGKHITEYIFCVLNILLCKSDCENSEKLDHCKIIRKQYIRETFRYMYSCFNESIYWK